MSEEEIAKLVANEVWSNQTIRWDPVTTTGTGTETLTTWPIEPIRLKVLSPVEKRRYALKILPRGDIDAPEYCTRCGAALDVPSYPPTEEAVYDPYTGRKAMTTMCPGFAAEPEKHDAWILGA
jgi:hypothetical protein